MRKKSLVSEDNISISSLKSRFAIEFVEAIDLSPFAQLIGIKKDDNSNEIVVVELEVEIPQMPKNDIRKREYLEIHFTPNDNKLPLVFSLRKDFPLVPHLYSRESEFPRCLCLYEKTFEELQLKWSSFEFLERIREWLMLTSKGKLHAADQPLEPFILHSNASIILPRDLFKRFPDDVICFKEIKSGDHITYISELVKDLSKIDTQRDFITTVIFGKPRTHGVISSTPRTINELNGILKDSDIDLIEELRSKLSLLNDLIKDKKVFNSGLIIIVVLPKQRDINVEYESVETKAFLIKRSIVDLGVDIGFWVRQDKSLGLLLPVDSNKTGYNIEVESLNSIDPFTAESARLYNENNIKNIRIAAIGVGSLGSQIYNNLLRQGFTNWTLIDNDILFPHNLARHTLGNADLGMHKIVALKKQAYELFGNDDLITTFASDLLKGKNESRLKEELKNSELILDISASIPVARTLALDIDSNARRLSIFTNPIGNELVVLSENYDRTLTLDVLEMQYYRELLHNDKLFSHLNQPAGRLRYGNSCRDISSRMSIENIAIFGGISTIEIKQLQKEPAAYIRIWQLNENAKINQINIEINQCYKKDYGDWTIIYDAYFIKKIYQLRAGKLPNETGGILLGSYDCMRKIIYVVDTIPSPPDSKEWPTVYIRGVKGLSAQLETVKKQTANMLSYIGEWHSHPEHSKPNPSSDDIEAFKWLTEVLHENGKPSLMLIAGDEFAFYLGKMEY